MVRIACLFIFLHLSGVIAAQSKTDRLLLKLLSASNSEVVQKVLKDPLAFRCQIIYTQINRDKHNKPTFKDYHFNYDPQAYFYPASMLKMPLAFLALEKLNEMNQPEVNKYTPIQFDTSRPEQQPFHKDPTSENGLSSIAHLIKRVFLISENDPSNRLYQFIGQQTINRKLHQKGFVNSRITRQYLRLTNEQHRHTNPVRFIKEDGQLLYSQPPAYNADSFNFSKSIKVGKGYLDKNNKLINEPFDFTTHNNMPLKDMQQMLQSVLFPESVKAKQRFNLSEEDYRFLYQYLSQYPSETSYPKYDTSEFYDSYVKFFFSNGNKKMPDHIRVFNKVGWAYGFMTDVSYVADFKNKVEYMLSATIYVNSDEILNDNKYEFETVGEPFMFEVGQLIYNYELARKRKNAPDLSRFRLQYDRRDPADRRPSVKEVDN
jgi:hypothetical protein